MKTQLNMDKIAKGLGAERQGKVAATGGYFGAMQLLADIEARFRVPSGGGRPTDPAWTERRLLTREPLTRFARESRNDTAKRRFAIWTRWWRRPYRRSPCGSQLRPAQVRRTSGFTVTPKGPRAEKASSVMSQFHHGAQMRFDLSWFL